MYYCCRMLGLATLACLFGNTRALVVVPKISRGAPFAFLRGERLPPSRCFVVDSLKRPHGAARKRLEAPAMVLDQFQPDARSRLKRRTYATAPGLFRTVQNNVSSWTDCLIFSDRPELESSSLVGPAARAAFTIGAYFAFPSVVSALQPVVFSSGSFSEQVQTGLTGSFLPGISLLFGALLSYTINILINRQIKIEDLVNQEVSHLLTATWHVTDLWRWDGERKRRALEAIWRHTDQLIFRSRYQEILGLVKDDPVADLMQMVISVNEVELASPAHADKPNIDREVLNFLRGLLMELNRLRTMRLSSEGRSLPPAHFVILACLAGLLLLGFTLASIQPIAVAAAATGAAVAGSGGGAGSVEAAAVAAAVAAAAADGAQHGSGGGVAFESRLLFTGLVFAYSLLLEFALDLTNPFTGSYNIRRTTTTAGLIRIRNDIVDDLGVAHVAAFDNQLRKNKRAQLQEFKELSGQSLPIDGHL